MSEKIETDLKTPQFKLNDRVRITKYKIFLGKVTLKIGQKKYLLLIVLKVNPWSYIIKDLNGEKIIGSFNQKELLLSIL